MKKRYQLLSLAMSLLLATLTPFVLGAPVAQAVGGDITTDTTWTAASSPYVVTDNIVVRNGATLTIEAGVEIKFDDGFWLQIANPTENGQLVAIGTITNPITFTSNTGTSPGAWGYIRFTDNSIDASYDAEGNYLDGSILQYAIVEYAGQDSGNFGALQMQYSAPFVDHSTIRRNATRGIYTYYSSPKLCHNTIISNTVLGDRNGGGVYISHGAVTLFENRIAGNRAGDCGGGIYISAPDTVTLSYNTVISNVAQIDGGGMYLHVSGDSVATVSDNIIVGNSTAVYGNGGGGICTDLSSSAQVTLTHNVIAENSTVESGGGILIQAGSSSVQVMVEHNSLVRNTAENDAAGRWEAAGGNFSSNTLVDNVVTGTSDPLEAVYIKGNPLFNANNIYRNTGYALYNGNLTGSPSLDATDNWWGTADEAAIQTMIHDGNDNSFWGIVDYVPYRTEHNTAAPISPPHNVFTDEARTILVWSPNSESDLAGYKVHWDTDSGYPYAHSLDVGNVTRYALTGPISEGTYYAVTAYDIDADGAHDQTDGNESWYSKEAEVRWWVYLPLMSSSYH